MQNFESEIFFLEAKVKFLFRRRYLKLKFVRSPTKLARFQQKREKNVHIFKQQPASKHDFLFF
jgi:hypothetical protein